jgi:hypothetical protein
MRRETPINVVGYARVSTEEQARDGVSLAAQAGKIEAYALAHLKAQGKRYCHTVYDNPEGIALMHRLRDEGYSYERIARHLNAVGLPTALGGP